MNLIPDIKFLITGTPFSLLGDLQLQTLLFARPFLLPGKPLPNSHISLCLIQAFYLFSTRQAHNASFAGCAFPGSACAHSHHTSMLCKAPQRYFSVLAKPPRCFSNKNPYNFKECLDNWRLEASVALLCGFIPNQQSSGHQIQTWSGEIMKCKYHLAREKSDECTLKCLQDWAPWLVCVLECWSETLDPQTQWRAWLTSSRAMKSPKSSD